MATHGLFQRFRYNEMAQRYAIYSDLWRKKGRIREEGYRRPQDALLSVQGVREAGHEPEHKAYGVGHSNAGMRQLLRQHWENSRLRWSARILPKSATGWRSFITRWPRPSRNRQGSG